jgi:uncharacterized protein (DUF2147 family)
MLRNSAMAAILIAMLTAPAALAQPGDNAQAATGLWLTAKHDAVVQIQACGQDLCGRIVGLARPAGEPVPTDWQGAPQCGLTIIDTAPETGAPGKVWNGSILDPRNGAVYHAQITLAGAGQLQLRGYVGIPLFGETQTWSRYNGPTGPQCEVPPTITGNS